MLTDYATLNGDLGLADGRAASQYPITSEK